MILFVVALPVITRQPNSVIAQVFSIVSFVCTTRSYGAVWITWKKFNSELPVTANITTSKSLNELTSILRLESVGYYKGHYYCLIENSAGLVNSTFAQYDISGTWVKHTYVAVQVHKFNVYA